MPSVFNNTPGRLPSITEIPSYGRFGNDFSAALKGIGGASNRGLSLSRLLDPTVLQEIAFMNQSTGSRLGSLRNAADALDPGNLGSLVDAYETNALGQAQGLGRRTANMLSKQYGSAPGVQAGAGLSALNSANSQTGQFRAQLFSPFNIANMYLGQASALGGGNVFQGFNQSLNALGGYVKPPGSNLTDTITGLAGTAFSGGWNPF